MKKNIHTYCMFFVLSACSSAKLLKTEEVKKDIEVKETFNLILYDSIHFGDLVCLGFNLTPKVLKII